MLATPGKLVSAPGWIYELKYDGFRCLVSKRGDVLRLESRRGRDMSALFPELVDEIQPIPTTSLPTASSSCSTLRAGRNGIACTSAMRNAVRCASSVLL